MWRGDDSPGGANDESGRDVWLAQAARALHASHDLAVRLESLGRPRTDLDAIRLRIDLALREIDSLRARRPGH